MLRIQDRAGQAPSREAAYVQHAGCEVVTSDTKKNKEMTEDRDGAVLF